MSQLTLFSHKAPFFKDLHNSTLSFGNDIIYKYDFTTSYGLPHADIMAMLMFLYKRTWDDPVHQIVFSYRDFCRFLKQNPDEVRKRYDKFRKKNDPPNYVHLILDRLHRNALQFSADYKFEADNQRYNVVSSKTYIIINQFDLLSNEHISSLGLDSREVYYSVKVNYDILLQLGNRSFYADVEDYATIRKKTIRRNPQLPILYIEMCIAANALAYNQNHYTQPSFNSLCYLLGYNIDNREPKTIKQQIERRIKQVLQYPSMKGLSFEWRPNKKGYYYIPHFYIEDKNQLELKEDFKSKFKRLDNYFVNKLKAHYDLPFDTYESAQNALNSGLAKQLFLHSYEACFGRNLEVKEQTEILNRMIMYLMYSDKAGNLYVSALANKVQYNKADLIQQKSYKEPNVVFLFDSSAKIINTQR